MKKTRFIEGKDRARRGNRTRGGGRPSGPGRGAQKDQEILEIEIFLLCPPICRRVSEEEIKPNAGSPSLASTRRPFSFLRRKGVTGQRKIYAPSWSDTILVHERQNKDKEKKRTLVYLLLLEPLRINRIKKTLSTFFLFFSSWRGRTTGLWVGKTSQR